MQDWTRESFWTKLRSELSLPGRPLLTPSRFKARKNIGTIDIGKPVTVASEGGEQVPEEIAEDIQPQRTRVAFRRTQILEIINILGARDNSMVRNNKYSVIIKDGNNFCEEDSDVIISEIPQDYPVHQVLSIHALLYKKKLAPQFFTIPNPYHRFAYSTLCLASGNEIEFLEPSDASHGLQGIKGSRDQQLSLFDFRLVGIHGEVLPTEVTITCPFDDAPHHRFMRHSHSHSASQSFFFDEIYRQHQHIRSSALFLSLYSPAGALLRAEQASAIRSITAKGGSRSVLALLQALVILGHCCGNVKLSAIDNVLSVAAKAGNATAVRVILAECGKCKLCNGGNRRLGDSILGGILEGSSKDDNMNNDANSSVSNCTDKKTNNRVDGDNEISSPKPGDEFIFQPSVPVICRRKRSSTLQYNVPNDPIISDLEVNIHALLNNSFSRVHKRLSASRHRVESLCRIEGMASFIRSTIKLIRSSITLWHSDVPLEKWIHSTYSILDDFKSSGLKSSDNTDSSSTNSDSNNKMSDTKESFDSNSDDGNLYSKIFKGFFATVTNACQVTDSTTFRAFVCNLLQRPLDVSLEFAESRAVRTGRANGMNKAGLDILSKYFSRDPSAVGVATTKKERHLEESQPVLQKEKPFNIWPIPVALSDWLLSFRHLLIYEHGNSSLEDTTAASSVSDNIIADHSSKPPLSFLDFIVRLRDLGLYGEDWRRDDAAAEEVLTDESFQIQEELENFVGTNVNFGSTPGAFVKTASSGVTSNDDIKDKHSTDWLGNASAVISELISAERDALDVLTVFDQVHSNLQSLQGVQSDVKVEVESSYSSTPHAFSSFLNRESPRVEGLGLGSYGKGNVGFAGLRKSRDTALPSNLHPTPASSDTNAWLPAHLIPFMCISPANFRRSITLTRETLGVGIVKNNRYVSSSTIACGEAVRCLLPHKDNTFWKYMLSISSDAEFMSILMLELDRSTTDFIATSNNNLYTTRQAMEDKRANGVFRTSIDSMLIILEQLSHICSDFFVSQHKLFPRNPHHRHHRSHDSYGAKYVDSSGSSKSASDDNLIDCNQSITNKLLNGDDPCTIHVGLCDWHNARNECIESYHVAVGLLALLKSRYHTLSIVDKKTHSSKNSIPLQIKNNSISGDIVPLHVIIGAIKSENILVFQHVLDFFRHSSEFFGHKGTKSIACLLMPIAARGHVGMFKLLLKTFIFVLNGNEGGVGMINGENEEISIDNSSTNNNSKKAVSSNQQPTIIEKNWKKAWPLTFASRQKLRSIIHGSVEMSGGIISNSSSAYRLFGSGSEVNEGSGDPAGQQVTSSRQSSALEGDDMSGYSVWTWTPYHALLTGCERAEDAYAKLFSLKSDSKHGKNSWNESIPNKHTHQRTHQPTWNNIGEFQPFSNLEKIQQRKEIFVDLVIASRYTPMCSVPLFNTSSLGLRDAVSSNTSIFTHTPSSPLPSLLDLAACLHYWDVVMCLLDSGALGTVQIFLQRQLGGNTSREKSSISSTFKGYTDNQTKQLNTSYYSHDYSERQPQQSQRSQRPGPLREFHCHLFFHASVLYNRKDVITYIVDKLYQRPMFSFEDSCTKDGEPETTTKQHEYYLFRSLLLSTRTFLKQSIGGDDRDVYKTLYDDSTAYGRHSILHDAMVARNEDMVLRLMMLTESILESNLDVDNFQVGGDNDNSISLSSSKCTYYGVNLLHYASYFGMDRVLTRLLQPPWFGHLLHPTIHPGHYYLNLKLNSSNIIHPCFKVNNDDENRFSDSTTSTTQKLAYTRGYMDDAVDDGEGPSPPSTYDSYHRYDLTLLSDESDHSVLTAVTLPFKDICSYSLSPLELASRSSLLCVQALVSCIIRYHHQKQSASHNVSSLRVGSSSPLRDDLLLTLDDLDLPFRLALLRRQDEICSYLLSIQNPVERKIFIRNLMRAGAGLSSPELLLTELTKRGLNLTLQWILMHCTVYVDKSNGGHGDFNNDIYDPSKNFCCTSAIVEDTEEISSGIEKEKAHKAMLQCCYLPQNDTDDKSSRSDCAVMRISSGLLRWLINEASVRQQHSNCALVLYRLVASINNDTINTGDYNKSHDTSLITPPAVIRSEIPKNTFITLLREVALSTRIRSSTGKGHNNLAETLMNEDTAYAATSRSAVARSITLRTMSGKILTIRKKSCD